MNFQPQYSSNYYSHQLDSHRLQVSALQLMAYQPQTLVHESVPHQLRQPKIYRPRAMDQQWMAQQSRPIAQQSWPGGQQFSQLSAQLQQPRNWESQELVQQQAAYQPLTNKSVVLEPQGFAQPVISAQVEDVQLQFIPQESQLAIPPRQSIAQLQQPMNIPQPIDHKCVVAQPQLATDQ